MGGFKRRWKDAEMVHELRQGSNAEIEHDFQERKVDRAVQKNFKV